MPNKEWELYKKIVSKMKPDVTQVLRDIGNAWVKDGGLLESVSPSVSKRRYALRIHQVENSQNLILWHGKSHYIRFVDFSCTNDIAFQKYDVEESYLLLNIFTSRTDRVYFSTSFHDILGNTNYPEY